MSNNKQNNGQLLSVIIPCFNEEAVIRETHRRLTEAMSQLPEELDYELVYVNDGSRDNTLPLLQELQKADKRVRVLSLSRNFGHQIAVTAGLEHAAGDATAIIDADLQDPPEVILEMVAAWQRGVDVAYGVRTSRAGETSFKLWTARTFYRIINRLSDVPIPLDTGDFRLLSRKAMKALLAMPERDRFVRGMVAWVGFRQEPIYYRREARYAGETKYPLTKMVRFATDGLLSFSIVPLRIASWAGILAIIFSLLGFLFALGAHLFINAPMSGSLFFFLSLLFISGVQLIFLGILGEYLGRIYGEVKNRPLYFIAQSYGFPTGDEQ
jgi:dolichol-phosphate mannosyltransferase